MSFHVPFLPTVAFAINNFRFLSNSVLILATGTCRCIFKGIQRLLSLNFTTLPSTFIAETAFTVLLLLLLAVAAFCQFYIRHTTTNKPKIVSSIFYNAVEKERKKQEEDRKETICKKTKTTFDYPIKMSICAVRLNAAHSRRNLKQQCILHTYIRCNQIIWIRQMMTN